MKALAYAIHNQRNRRNLTDADILRLVETLDKRKPQTAGLKKGAETPVTGSQATGRTSDNTASVIGTSRDKVERTRTVLDHATTPVKDAVKSGEMSITFFVFQGHSRDTLNLTCTINKLSRNLA